MASFLKVTAASSMASSNAMDTLPPRGNCSTRRPPGHPDDSSCPCSCQQEAGEIGVSEAFEGDQAGRSSEGAAAQVAASPPTSLPRGQAARTAGEIASTHAAAAAAAAAALVAPEETAEASRSSVAEALPPTGSRAPTVRPEAARRAAARLRETFGLSLFGFDLIIDSFTGEPLVVDVNYFPSFKDLEDFPQARCCCSVAAALRPKPRLARRSVPRTQR